MWSLDNGHWDWTVFDLQAQKYLYLLRSSDSQYGDKIWWQNSWHHWFREWLVISLVPAIAWTNACIVNWNLRNKLMLNFIANINSLCCWNLMENVICKTVAILFRPWCFNSMEIISIPLFSGLWKICIVSTLEKKMRECRILNFFCKNLVKCTVRTTLFGPL